MSTFTLLFPHQLFEKNPALQSGRPVVLVEEYLFFRQYPFHQQKLVFHRASMKAYASFLQRNGYSVTYIEAHDPLSDIRKLLPHLQAQGTRAIHHIHTTDNWLQKRITTQAMRLGLQRVEYESPLFLLNGSQVQAYFQGKKRFYQTDFYTQQRKQFRLLVDDQLQPVGGQWTYDIENRLKYPKKKTPPPVHFPEINSAYAEAISYVEKYFGTNPGIINRAFTYPTTFQESQAWLQQFLEFRLAEFGAYEDALVNREHILHHSVLTPMLNVGLLTPRDVLNQVIDYAQQKDIPLNSLEGFVRQILGWREFIRGVYETKGSAERTTNFWKFKRKIPRSFWTGTTGIVPIDGVIRKVLATGYCHHIERLMVLGNFMLLCEFDPDDVYQWFMELFIDAYDWVMVPNIYGMSQFADGGLMATKPYISGSNYLMKMSDYEKGEWQLVWDGLFWRFLHTHRDFFARNPRLSMLVKTFDKMPDEKRNEHLRRAEAFLQKLDESKRE